MAINSSGAVLMEPLPAGRRPGPPIGPHGNYGRPNSSSNQCLLPPVHQSQNSSNGVWRGSGPMPPGPHGYGAGTPLPDSSHNSPPMLMRGGSGPNGTPLPQAPHPPPPMNYPNHSPRPMPPNGLSSGISPRPLVGPPSSASSQQPLPPPQPMLHGQRPPSGSGSPNMPPVNLSNINNSTGGGGSGAGNGSRNGPQRPPMAPPPHHPPQQQRPGQQERRGPRVASVARGPQPTSTEPTRLLDGRKIKDVQRHQQQQNGGQGEAHRGPHRFTGPGKNGMAPKQHNNNNEPRPIKTTVGNDESWVKGLTYSTWVDSPRGNLNDLDTKDGPYKRNGNNNNNNNHNNRRRKPQKKDSNTSSTSGGVMEMLRNLFR